MGGNHMGYDPSLWCRMTIDGVAVYVRKDKSSWFVPNQAGDRVLVDLASSPNGRDDLMARRFLDRLPDSTPYD